MKIDYVIVYKWLITRKSKNNAHHSQKEQNETAALKNMPLHNIHNTKKCENKKVTETGISVSS